MSGDFFSESSFAMGQTLRFLPILVLPALVLAGPVLAADAEHGAYVFASAGCASCHTMEKGGAFLAGGRELKTDFGSFFTPNITPDTETGIGGWSDKDFLRAMREGVSPEGDHYYPTFPYTSYARMSDEDLLDLKAYLETVPAVRNEVRDHDLHFPFNIRMSVFVWKLLFFDVNRFEPNPAKSDAWNRGAYLVNGPGHCGECHSPRNILGAMDNDRALSGNSNGPEGDAVPNITRGPGGIGDWSEDEIVVALEIGMMPDGDFLGGAMTDVIDENTGKLSDDDRRAIATYLTSLPPLASNN
jgi:mono/diheme cytochrome c family protein